MTQPTTPFEPVKEDETDPHAPLEPVPGQPPKEVEEPEVVNAGKTKTPQS